MMKRKQRGIHHHFMGNANSRAQVSIRRGLVMASVPHAGVIGEEIGIANLRF